MSKHLTSNISGTRRRNFAKFSGIVAFGTPHLPHIRDSFNIPKFEPNFRENLSSEISLTSRNFRGSDSLTNIKFIENSDEPFEVTKLGNEIIF